MAPLLEKLKAGASNGAGVGMLLVLNVEGVMMLVLAAIEEMIAEVAVDI